MRKVVIAIAMVMGLGTSVAFAQEVNVSNVSNDTVQVQQNPQDEFTKIDAKELPEAVMQALGKEYPGATIKEAAVANKETGKVFKVVLVVTNEDQTTTEVTALMNEKGEPVKA